MADFTPEDESAARDRLDSALSSLDMESAYEDGSITQEDRRATIEAMIEAGAADLNSLGEVLAAAMEANSSEAKAEGRITPLAGLGRKLLDAVSTFRDEAGKLVRRIFLAASLALSGPNLEGPDKADVADGAAVHETLLDNFVEQVKSGEQAPSGIASRVASYARAAWAVAMNAELGKRTRGGTTEAKRVLGALDSCEVCPREARRGWTPIDEVLPIGQTPCKFGCRSHILYRSRSNSAAATSRTEGRTVNMTQVRAALSASLHRPWMIRRDAADMLRTESRREGPSSIFRPAAESDNEGDAYWKPRPAHDATSLVDGVMVIPIYGPIFRHKTYMAEMMAEVFGGTSLACLTDHFRAALSDSGVKGILFTIDSPGGIASGVADFAHEIRAGCAIKPIAAYAEGQCCSAAYYLGAATGEIWCSPEAMVGSIGVVFPCLDDSKLMENLGLKDVSVVSDQSPDKWADPADPEGRKLWQATANSMAAQFIADVAKYRGVPVATVLKDFGRGWLKVGSEAKSAGMVDRVGTFADALQKMSGPGRNRLAQVKPVPGSVTPSPASESTISPTPGRVRLTTRSEAAHGRIVPR